MSADNDMLDDRQAGHLRHFRNLARQPVNDWSLMQGRAAGQEDFGAYRFQLAYMAYALALAHRHRLPAAPGAFKPTFERLMEKILQPEVWTYWARVSRGGSIFNAHLASTYQEEWNPVVRDNIMYSAYVQSMALLFDYLFDDSRFAAPGALTFRYWSYFWGGGERRFKYDQNSLNEHIYWQMVESGYLGVACEPNCVFQICNQPAILGFRLHDLLNGGSVAEEVTAAYQQAWSRFGRVGENGHYHAMVQPDTMTLRPNAGKAVWVDAWCGTLMNMWNRDFVHRHYPAQRDDLLLPARDGALSVRSAPRPEVMGQKVINDDSDFGWTATWASEMGDADTLQGLLRHADRHMAPRWRDGGLYFPRNDIAEDAQGNRTLVEPMAGNVLLGYASLNVPDGLWRLYNEPWGASQHQDPALVQVDDEVDVLQARYDGTARRLSFTLRAGANGPATQRVTLGRLGDRRWSMRRDGVVVANGRAAQLDAAGVGIRRSDTGDTLVLDCPATGTASFEMQFEGDSAS